MTDQRFRELLNLYLDGELSAAERAELQAEVCANPARASAVRRARQLEGALRTACREGAALRVVTSARPTAAGVSVWLVPMAAAATLLLVGTLVLQQLAARRQVTAPELAAIAPVADRPTSPDRIASPSAAPVVVAVAPVAPAPLFSPVARHEARQRAAEIDAARLVAARRLASPASVTEQISLEDLLGDQVLAAIAGQRFRAPNLPVPTVNSTPVAADIPGERLWNGALDSTPSLPFARRPQVEELRLRGAQATPVTLHFGP